MTSPRPPVWTAARPAPAGAEQDLIGSERPTSGRRVQVVARLGETVTAPTEPPEERALAPLADASKVRAVLPSPEDLPSLWALREGDWDYSKEDAKGNEFRRIWFSSRDFENARRESLVSFTVYAYLDANSARRASWPSQAELKSHGWEPIEVPLTGDGSLEVKLKSPSGALKACPVSDLAFRHDLGRGWFDHGVGAVLDSPVHRAEPAYLQQVGG